MTYGDNSEGPENNSLAQSRVPNRYADDGDVHGATVKESEERATVEKGAPLHRAIVDEGATMKEVATVDEYESASVTAICL